MIGLKEGAMESPDGTKRKDIKKVLATPQGLNIQMARKAFEDFDNRVDDAYDSNTNPPQYVVYGDAGDKNDETDIIYVLGINHIQWWNDIDFDYGGGNTKVKIRLTPEGKIEYEFSGDKMESDRFLKDDIENLIEEIAKGL
jgi:hypothetical protein